MKYQIALLYYNHTHFSQQFDLIAQITKAHPSPSTYICDEQLRLKQKFPLVKIIEIVKIDGAVLYCYHREQFLVKPIPLEVVRKEVINSQRKLLLCAYQNGITELLIKDYYVYFKVRNNVIIYAIATSYCSYTTAEQSMEKIIEIYDETIGEVLGMSGLPKNMPSTSLIKLQSMYQKVGLLMNQIFNTQNNKYQNKPQNILQAVNEIKSTVLTKIHPQRSIYNRNQELIQSATQLRNEITSLTRWMTCRKYLFFVFVGYVVVLTYYIVSIYY